jgi:DNA-binding MarR family transcriptional regulator
MEDVKPHEYTLLNEIAQDSMVTQAGLAEHLGIAVGSVNWYIKRLVQRGWIKVSHLDRTRLKYDLTSRGMRVFTQRAILYARDSLKVYAGLRQKATELVAQLKGEGIGEVYIGTNDEPMDIMRLTCLEQGVRVSPSPVAVRLVSVAQGFQAIYEIQEGESD